jgi:hypothetical protein
MHQSFNVYIKAFFPNASSIFMAEATTLLLAGTIVSRLGISEASFLSDNRQLVSYINNTTKEQIPRWDAKLQT